MGIGNKLVFDVNNNVEDFTFILSTRDYRHLGAISNINRESVVYNAHLNSANDIQFEVYKSYKKKDKNINESLWNDIVDLKLVYVKELNEYFEITVSLDDSNENIKKTITATSLCESELSQTYINGLEVNTESDIARDDYVITTFYNFDNHDASLLHRVLSYAPNYTLKHVDSSLINIQRSFSVDSTSVYDFLTGECAEQFQCIFIFDSTDRTISVYDLCTVCLDCGNRDEYNSACPECGSTNLKYLGKDTTIYVDKENLTNNINFTADVSSIKNCFKLVAGDDTMTATIRLLNMNGTDNIVYVSDEQKKDMPKELVEKIESYDDLYLSKTEEYESIVGDIYEAIDKINYYTHSMMPTIQQSKVTAQTEADKLTSLNLSPLGLNIVSTSTSIATVESALKNYAKVYIKTGYVKIEVNSSNYRYVGKDLNGYNYGTWTGNFKVTNYSDSEDIAYSEVISVKVHDNYQDFIEQKIMKNISNSSDDKECSVFDVLSIENLDDFKEALTYYSLNRLTSFYDAIQAAMDTLIELNQANTSAEFYEVLYLPYYKKLRACQSEIDKRQATIDEWTQIYETSSLQQAQIQKELNFKNYLGEDLYKIFCAYRREDTYQNNNYISDGLNDTEVIELSKEFIETAKKELIKSATPKYSISSTLHNLLIIPEFKSLINMFELGNFIRICVDGEIYRLRLIRYTLSFSSIQSLEVEFSDVTKIKDLSNDIRDILNSAQSMSTNYSYVSMQANKGNNAREEINDWVKNGLKSSLIQIKNNNNEEVTFDSQGLSCRSYDDISNSYSPEKVRVTHNIIAFTEDDWLTCSLGLGKHNYVYYDGEKFVTSVGFGLSSKFSQNSYIYGSQIIGGEIISENYSSTTGTYINLKDGTFSFGGGKITYNGNSLILNGVDLMWADIVDAPTKVSEFENDSGYQNAIQVTKITKDTVTAPFIKTLNLTVGNEIIMGSNATISWNNVTNHPTIPSKTSQLTNDSGYQNSSQVTTITKNTITTSYVNALNITAGSVAAENITGTYIYGKIINGGKIIGTEISNGNGTFYVDKYGSVTASDINITGGTIGEFKLYYSKTSGSYYLETIPTTSAPLTTGIGNNSNWAFWTGYSYSTNTATFWVTNDGEVHMRNWLYGITRDSWVIWTTTDRSNRYGLEYIFGDWDDNQKIMNIKFVFYDYSNGKKFHYNLPLTGTISGMP